MSITKQVWAFIQDDEVIRRALAKRIISYTNLAEHIQDTGKIEGSRDAIISAIRRYQEKNPIEKQYSKTKRVISRSQDIRITSNILEISVEKNNKTQQILQKAFSAIDYEKGELLLVIQGEQSVKLLINQRNKKKVLKLIPTSSILDIEENLAEINIQLDEQARKTPGVLAIFGAEMAMHNINIIETMSCLPEILFFVKQKDVVKAYEVLFELCRL